MRDGRAQAWALAVLTLFGAFAVQSCFAKVPAPDFTALWSFGRMMQDHPAAALYDDERLRAYQAALGMDPSGNYPFLYPPIFLLLVWPLGLLPVGPAFHAWIACTMALFIGATSYRRLGFASVLLLLSPATVMGVVAGQNGFLSGALLLGGLRLIGQRPWLGGLLIALLTFKPQLGLLVPVALAAAGAWRGIAATCMWVGVLAALSCLLFGMHIWADWLGSLPGYSRDLEDWSAVLRLQPTPLANMRLAGTPLEVAQGVQAVLGCIMAVAVWRTWRTGISAQAIGTLVAATFVAAPYAFFYDMPMVTAAVLYLGAARVRDGTLGVLDAALLVLVLCLPAAMAFTDHAISLPVVLAFAVWAAAPAWRSHGRFKTLGTA